MKRTARNLLLLGVAAGGAWAVRRALVERSQRAARRQAWMSSGAPTGPYPLPAAPVLTDADALRRAPAPPAEVTIPPTEAPIPPAAAVAADPTGGAIVDTAPTAPEALVDDQPAAAATTPVEDRSDESPAPTGEPIAGSPSAPLDQVRQRLASLDVEVPAERSGPAPSGNRTRRARRAPRWIGPLEDGSCRATHPVKVKLRSGLFHLPGMLVYDRTRADRCYRSAEDAVADGFEQAKR